MGVSQQLAIAAPAGVWRPLERIGEGATSIVWRARHAQSGQLVALKLARGPMEAIALSREAALLARVARRWGPALVDAGQSFLVTEWVEGAALVSAEAHAGRSRETLAAIVAHGVGRALEELHEAGVHHGDVKPSNVLLAQERPAVDAAAHRGATLIDLGLAAEAGASLGGTPRYASPELRAKGEGGPAADLWALGLLLAELLDPNVADVPDPHAAIGKWTVGDGSEEPARWVSALLSVAPGGRPQAAWVAARAASWLKLSSDSQEGARRRVERVKRAYLNERARDVVPGATISPGVGEPARGWLEHAIAWSTKLAAPTPDSEPPLIEPLAPVRLARWLVTLVGPSAAAWPLGAGGESETKLTARAVALARTREPAGWTRDDIAGHEDVVASVGAAARDNATGSDRAARLVRELARAEPSPWAIAAAEDDVARAMAPPTLVVELASSLSRAGETGRAWAVLLAARGPEADALRAEVARRRGDREHARESAERVVAEGAGSPRWRAQATLARLAWDAGDWAEADRQLEGARGPAAAEVRALLAWRRGEHEVGLRHVEQALAGPLEAEALARLQGARGLLHLGRGAAGSALEAFGRAVELATRAGAVLDEATYLTSEAAAAADAGDFARTLASATRAALLWERLGRPESAGRAWLARAAALATVGARHATDEAADEACSRATQARDVETAAYALWARVEVRPPGDAQASAWALDAAADLRGRGAEGELRAASRLLVWAPDALGVREREAGDHAAATASAPARWEWWGARAHALAAGGQVEGGGGVLAALLGLVDVPAPLGSRGPSLDAAVGLATILGDGEAARRFEAARVAAVRALREGTPPEFQAALATVGWTHETSMDGAVADVTFAPAQVAQLESIVRALSGRDRLRPLLEQVLDTMVLWAGVERGLLLIRAPDGRLVPRAARNLARHDLVGDQLVLSQTIARRAIETGDAVVATDALSTLGDVHASVHALRLRSVLAVPLQARGETLGVVYLDDRVRKGAFGPRELAWVRVVASQAAMAIADARDAVLLRRAARRAERARQRVEEVLREREAELDVTRTQLELARDGRETAYPYDEIAGRSEPMRALLRLVDRVTASDVPVLLVGESGTGKELIARAVHSNGPRARRPFVTENCASVPETLLESTLFGHVRGAFTGASSTRAGLFDVADGGTLLLDEIGEMSLAMQAKLLRVLQEGEVRAVGGERVRKVDVRVIGATHRDLSAMVGAGAFREDLLYRLNVITLRIPPLRERQEDIPLLVDHFVRKHAVDRSVRVTRAAMAKITRFPWPGNVRQLENEIRRALVLGDGAIDVTELSADVVRGTPGAARGHGLDLRSRVNALEAEMVIEALTRTHGNQTRAAQLLGLSRFGLQKMMKRLSVKL